MVARGGVATVWVAEPAVVDKQQWKQRQIALIRGWPWSADGLVPHTATAAGVEGELRRNLATLPPRKT
jgi:hypothetical protein